jgi:hypothetical protein
VTERGIVVVTVDDEPRIEPIAPEALARESSADQP